MDNRKIKYRIAVAGSDGIMFKQHFGRASLYNSTDRD